MFGARTLTLLITRAVRVFEFWAKPELFIF